jgi:DNA-binding IclR family transcriptional regulator
VELGALTGSMAPVDSFFVTRTLQAIEVLAFEPSTAPQIAAALRIDARTARRLLTRLADDGWVVPIEGRVRKYTLSLRLVALVSQFLARAPLARAAAPIVDVLHAETGAVAYVTVPSYRSVLCLAHGARDPRSKPRIHELIPAHASAGGKVLLAHRAPWRESVLERPLEPLTERTIIDADRVRAECDATLDRGFAVEDGEYALDLQGVAAPVPDESGDVMAAIALSAPRDVDVAAHAASVVDAAERLRVRLREERVAAVP